MCPETQYRKGLISRVTSMRGLQKWIMVFDEQIMGKLLAIGAKIAEILTAAYGGGCGYYPSG